MRCSVRRAGTALASFVVAISSSQAPPIAAAQGAEREVALDEVIAYAEQHAPALRVADAQRGYAAAARAEAEPVFPDNPTFEAGVGPRFDGIGGAEFDVEAALSQPVAIAGERGQRFKIADRVAARVKAETGATRWRVRRAVTAAYQEAIVARERVRLSALAVAFSAQMLAIAERRTAAGDLSAIDLRVAQSELAHVQQAQLEAAQELRAAQLALCAESGWPLERPPLPRAGLAELTAPPPLADSLRAAGAHPEALAARAATAEAHARVALADKEAWPTPVLGVHFEREGAVDPSSPTNYILLATIGVALPFFHTNQAERARARADASVAVAEADAAARARAARIAQAHADMQSSYERAALLQKSANAPLEDSLQLLQRGFDSGEIPLLEVAVARERFLQAQRDTLDAYADYYRARAQLEDAVGRALLAPDAREPGGTP
jgi:cobalt-zinc-cadmium efflux system outer membrane protein